MLDALGDRMKGYEGMETCRILMSRLPIYARLDGKCFSSFTRKMSRPYDANMSRLMIDTTKFLLDETSATIGYTQSDEISLSWHYPDYKSEPLFGGKIQKINSVLSGMASAFFAVNAYRIFGGSTYPSFDCRVFNLPNLEECANAFLWRELDATKNAITMLAQTYFSHKQLHGVSGDEKQEMLFREHGINFNDMPAFFKRGTLVRRENELRQLTIAELEKIPEAYRPTEPVLRSKIVEMDMPKLSTVKNRAKVLFNMMAPEIDSMMEKA